MGIRSIFVALLGLAVAGGSAYGAREYMIAKAPVADAAAELVSVVVATQDIPFGVAISSNMLSYQPWPKVALPAGAFTRIDDLVRASELPRRAKYAMPAGQLVMASQVSGFGEKVTLVQTLGPNSRAMAIKVDAETAVGGFVTPGDRVDILMTQGNAEELRSITILQNIRILGVDQDANEQTDTPGIAKTVTVEVTPLESQKLALAMKAGTLSLSLRTLVGVIDKPMEYTSLADLMQEEEPVVVVVEEAAPVAPVEPPPRRTVIVRKAGEAEVVELR